MSYDKETTELIYEEWDKKKYPPCMKILTLNEWISMDLKDELGIVAQILFEWGYLNE